MNSKVKNRKTTFLLEMMRTYIVAILLNYGTSLDGLAQINTTKDLKIDQCIANWVVQSEVSGMTIISNSIPPLEKGCEELVIKNGNFTETLNNWPTGGWCVPDFDEANRLIDSYIYANQRLPQPSEIAYKMGMTLGEYGYIFGQQKKFRTAWTDQSVLPPRISLLSNPGIAEMKNYLHFSGTDSAVMKSPDFELRPGKPHLLSLWVRSKIGDSKPSLYFWFDAGLEDIKVGYNSLPNTNGEWKRVSLYLRVPSDMKKAHFTLNFRGLQNEFIDITDFRLRTATEDEFSAAYKIERAKRPAHKAIQTEEHGKYLTATIAKLERKMGLPDKPFLIWGVGSSWTNSLDDLEPVRQTIRERFPNSPEIVYRKRCGSGTPYDFARGWVQTDVIAEQPDLIISYTNGSVKALEKMLIEIRKRSSADIIIPSLHFFRNEQLTEKNINQPVFDSIRSVCEKYNAQFVDNRRELAGWLLSNNKPVTALLSDYVHQNILGKQLILENIAAHFQANSKPGYNPLEIERTYSLKQLIVSKDQKAKITSGWRVEGDNVVCNKAGEKIKFEFEGNRIDLIGYQVRNGGRIKVLIDGVSADKYPAFDCSYVNPAITNIAHNGKVSQSSRGNADTGPHGVKIGTNLIPQKWTIRMLDDEGNYELSGSVTRSDGKGNSRKPFTSNSGQIIIDPLLWRHPQANRKDDRWNFEVSRNSIPEINFKAADITQRRLFSTTLVQNIKNDVHNVEIITEGNDSVIINSLYVFKPILK